jgi:hypothetical protein
LHQKPQKTIKCNIIINKIRIFANVLAIVEGQIDALAYIPIKIIIPGPIEQSAVLLIILGFFVISVLTILLLFAAFYFYRKYFKYKSQIEYEQADLRNLASLTKPDTELGEVNRKKQKDKYSTLVEDMAKI